MIPTIAIATIMPAIAGMKYMSATDTGAAGGSGSGSGACITAKAVSAFDGQ